MLRVHHPEHATSVDTTRWLNEWRGSAKPYLAKPTPSPCWTEAGVIWSICVRYQQIRPEAKSLADTQTRSPLACTGYPTLLPTSQNTILSVETSTMGASTPESANINCCGWFILRVLREDDCSETLPCKAVGHPSRLVRFAIHLGTPAYTQTVTQAYLFRTLKGRASALAVKYRGPDTVEST